MDSLVTATTPTLSKVELEKYKETYGKFLEVLMLYHNTHIHFTEKLRDKTREELRRMARELKKLSKQLHEGIQLSYNENVINRKNELEFRTSITKAKSQKRKINDE